MTPLEIKNDRKTSHIYTVSELTQDIKLILENTFGEIWVEGEVSNFSAYPSGHFYFVLKDDAAILPAVMFSRANREIKFKIENGLKVICLGKIIAYSPRGQYQIIVEKIEPKGIGSLQLALEQLKEKLEKQGLFSPERKRQIPCLPMRIGVVTSLQGAAIKDILKVLERRFKNIRMIIYPVRVQGEGAKEEIAQAIQDLNLFNQEVSVSERIEVMIVGRGGGSMEDLWAFNEELVARAIYHSQIPVISAVGHERDVTIADLVADVRAATPSVAAEIVIPKKEDLKGQIEELTADLKRILQDSIVSFQDTREDLIHRLSLSIDHLLEINAGNFNALYRKLVLLNPLVIARRYQERVMELAKQIYSGINHFFKVRNIEFHKAAEKLTSLSPLNILARGYSIT
ncbi:MAG: exodeoxyribonuclease VII large subunit, partial [Candidatus Omnitrophica bacterium]|nr:exodeoxyribonuclease VII large subunit [Candidatus Omnitrophota bacterium]